MEAEGDHIRRYNYTGGRVPHDVTHVTIDASVTVIPANAFRRNRKIVEVICDVNVKGVGRGAFFNCPCLRRVIMPGVEIVEDAAFIDCEALTDVECGKLERIKECAFGDCYSLRSINLSSAKIVERSAFSGTALTDVKFGSKLDRIEGEAFMYCYALHRITIPLKDGIITHDSIFQECEKLERVDLVEGEVHETIAALQLEEWRNDMYGEIDSINQILPTVSADSDDDDDDDVGDYEDDEGGKAQAIRTWIRSVLRKIIRYKAEHRRLLDEAATTLQLALPQDIVMNNVLPFVFVELPSHTFAFELEDHEEEEDDSVREEEVEEEEQGDDNEHSDDDFDDDGNASLEEDDSDDDFDDYGNASLEEDGSRKRRRMEYHA